MFICMSHLNVIPKSDSVLTEVGMKPTGIPLTVIPYYCPAWSMLLQSGNILRIIIRAVLKLLYPSNSYRLISVQ